MMSRADKDAMVAVLRKVADAIKNLDADGWDSILEGNFKVEISTGAGVRNRPRPDFPAVEVAEISAMAADLHQAASREVGVNILESRGLSKDGLVQLARHLDIPVQKRDAVDKIRDRIVDATIGYRLRSRAIQGTNLDGSNPLED